MERIEKMTVKVGEHQISYREDVDIVSALNTVEPGSTINLTLVTVGEDGYCKYTQVEDICIDDIYVDDIRVIGGGVYYDPAE